MSKRTVGTAPVEYRPQSRLPEWWGRAAVIAALALLAFANGLPNGFIGDDKIQLLKNPLVTDVRNIGRVFGSGVWSILGVRGNYYRPLQFLVYLLVHAGVGFHAWAYHLLMLLLHVANTLLVFALIRRLNGVRVASAAAALFAVHPIHTEAVDWIAALPDLMMTTFVLAGAAWLARRKGTAGKTEIAGHCALYLAALLSKETGVMLLPLYAGFGWVYLRRGADELRGNTRLYGAMAGTLGIYLVLRVVALGAIAPGQQTFYHLGPAELVFSAVLIAAKYFAALLMPVKLNYFHVFHPTATLSPEALLAGTVVAALVYAGWRATAPAVRYGLFWMAATLIPALNLTGVGQNVFAERYLYLPSVGFCWIAGWAWDQLANRHWAWARAAGCAVILACAVAAAERNRDWRDDFTLLQVTERQSPDSAWVHNSLAGAYVERNDFTRALEEERLAVRYEPGAPAYRRNLGNILLAVDAGAAAAEFERLVGIQPGLAENHADLALAYEASGDVRRAAAEYEKALRIQAGNAEAQQGYWRVMHAQ